MSRLIKTNVESSCELIAELLKCGVREFCVCAGSRNSPLVAVLSSGAFQVRLYSFAEERAASFFAIGRIQESGLPVAVVTTSGTAAAELFPAVIESYYSGWPLVCVTADRPAAYRGTGAPQSIEQVELFGTYTQGAFVNWEEPLQRALLKRGLPRRPVHLNVAFDEPLLDAPFQELGNLEDLIADHPLLPLRNENAPREQVLSDLQAFLKSAQRPLVCLGALPESAQENVGRFLLALGAPVYAEAASGLREDASLENLLVRSGERMLGRRSWDAVLRIGGVPSTRFWRDLENRRQECAVFHLTEQGFPGLTHGKCATVSLKEFFEADFDDWGGFSYEDMTEFFEEDRAHFEHFQELLVSHPRSEPALVHSLSRFVPPRAHIYLGNSLPIREWDLAATRRFRGLKCRVSRGANGIDGQVSTFLGTCREETQHWALLGDLTTLYDLTAPWIVPQLSEEISFQIVVLNNQGGRIFSRVPALQSVEPAMRRFLFENAHSVRFESWARLWNLGFEEWHEIPPHPPASRQGIVELRPDTESTEKFWSDYDALWSSDS